MFIGFLWINMTQDEHLIAHWISFFVINVTDVNQIHPLNDTSFING